MTSEDFSFLFDPVAWPLVFFLAFFCACIAIFYTVLISVLDIKYRPKWLFFALLPAIIIIVAGISRSYVLTTFLCIFLFTFVLGISSMINRGIKGTISDLKNSKSKRPLWQRILIIPAVILFGILFMASGPYAFFLIIVYAVINRMFFPNETDKFLRLQATLPTSKIRSMAMGLVEVEGKTIMTEPLISRIKKKECIGYTYRIESISKNSDGKNTYSTIHYETVCNSFILKDDTGSVEINAEEIELINLPEKDYYTSNGKRYTQHILTQDIDVLLIGKANNQHQKVIIEKEPIKDIFTLSPIDTINIWNKFNPLRKSFITYLVTIVALIAMILMLKVDYDDNIITLSFESMEGIFNLKKN
ncbi:hypothetical protein [Aquimarina sp. MMG016]|uniref:DUF3488 domain-containing protein n=1 Tax=Aquimarina sp. MMG016 TaxID=2822690 RepID=UPI001B39EF62|nr:hypothetical protein [Aquimarina sp. MMG016]MBQ4821272.1 hypothetical protein [Aquimarina sp. MMG016]